MRKINLKTRACGPGGNYKPGPCVVDDVTAAVFVGGGFAVYMDKEPAAPAVETAAMAPPVENAALPAAPVGRHRARRGGDEA